MWDTSQMPSNDHGEQDTNMGIKGPLNSFRRLSTRTWKGQFLALLK